MARIALFLAVILVLSPYTSAQFAANFTSVVIGYGPQSVTLVPANITEADGTQYWDIERAPIDAPEGEWSLDLLNVDGSKASFQESNGDLVVVDANGVSNSVSSRLPPLLGITGPELVGVVSNNAELAVTSAYADPDNHRITNAQANQLGNAAVDQILTLSSLPPFFLTPFKAQAYQQISSSLATAQNTSAAVHAAEVANGGAAPATTPTTTGNTVILDYNLTSFDINNLDNVKELVATWGGNSVDVVINGEVQGVDGDAFGSYITNLNVVPNNENSEWQLSWVDNTGETHLVVDQNGAIVVVNPDGSFDDVSEQAGWWSSAEGGDLDLAVGNAIEDFVDAVVENDGQNVNGVVTINVGPQGLNWTYPATAAQAETAQPTF